MGASLAWLYDFVTVECDVLPGETLTANQLCQRIESICDTSDKHFLDAGRLVRFLKKTPTDKIFDENEFQKFLKQLGLDDE